MERRDFLKSTLAATAASTLAAAPLAAAAAAGKSASAAREHYELRAYRLKPDAPTAGLDAYLERAFIPGLNGRGVERVGVFTGSAAGEGPVVWVFIPFRSLDTFVDVSADLHRDPAVVEAGAQHLGATKDQPAFERIDSWLLRAFAGMPQLELPEFSRAKQPRIFEMRMYESFSELKALKKMDMFDEGEIDIMREVGLAPVFFGQALTGPNLPHLTYMTSATDAAAHKAHWDAFRVHPGWVKMRADPQYKDTVSKNTSRMLTPAAYSQI